MGIPDGDEFFQPTIQNGWLHTLTCPRELTLVAGKIIQKPARELQQLRRDEQTWQGIADYCLPLDITHAETEIVTEHPFIADFGGDMTLSFDGEWLRLSRKNRRTGEPEHRVWQGQLRKLTVLSDASSLEIFINDGEAVMSARYFPVLPAQLNLQGSHQITLRHWSLAECVIE